MYPCILVIWTGGGWLPGPEEREKDISQSFRGTLSRVNDESHSRAWAMSSSVSASEVDGLEKSLLWRERNVWVPRWIGVKLSLSWRERNIVERGNILFVGDYLGWGSGDGGFTLLLASDVSLKRGQINRIEKTMPDRIGGVNTLGEETLIGCYIGFSSDISVCGVLCFSEFRWLGCDRIFAVPMYTLTMTPDVVCHRKSLRVALGHNRGRRRWGLRGMYLRLIINQIQLHVSICGAMSLALIAPTI